MDVSNVTTLYSNKIIKKAINITPPLLKANIQDNISNTNDQAVVLTLSKASQEKLEDPKYADGNQEIIMNSETHAIANLKDLKFNFGSVDVLWDRYQKGLEAPRLEAHAITPYDFLPGLNPYSFMQDVLGLNTKSMNFDEKLIQKFKDVSTIITGNSNMASPEGTLKPGGIENALTLYKDELNKILESNMTNTEKEKATNSLKGCLIVAAGDALARTSSIVKYSFNTFLPDGIKDKNTLLASNMVNSVYQLLVNGMDYIDDNKNSFSSQKMMESINKKAGSSLNNLTSKDFDLFSDFINELHYTTGISKPFFDKVQNSAINNEIKSYFRQIYKFAYAPSGL